MILLRVLEELSCPDHRAVMENPTVILVWKVPHEPKKMHFHRFYYKSKKRVEAVFVVFVRVEGELGT